MTAAALVGVVLVLTSLPASADEGLGEPRGSGLSALDTVLLFFGIPALVFAVVIALVYGLSRNNEPRLREGQSWWTEPDYNTRESIGIQDHSADAPSAEPRPTNGTTDGGGTGARW